MLVFHISEMLSPAFSSNAFWITKLILRSSHSFSNGGLVIEKLKGSSVIIREIQYDLKKTPRTHTHKKNILNKKKLWIISPP